MMLRAAHIGSRHVNHARSESAKALTSLCSRTTAKPSAVQFHSAGRKHQWRGSASLSPYTCAADVSNDNQRIHDNLTRWKAKFLLAIAGASAVLASNNTTLLEKNIDSESLGEEERNHDVGISSYGKSTRPIATSVLPVQLHEGFLQRRVDQKKNLAAFTTLKQTSPDFTKLSSDVTGLYKALDQMHERQKVRLGRLLHDLHQLAETASPTEVDVQDANHETKNNKAASMSHLRRIVSKKLTPQNLHQVSFDGKVDRHKKTWDLISHLRNGGVLRKDDLKNITKAASVALKKDATVVDLRDRKDIKRVTVVGDLHGQLDCLYDVLSLVSDDGPNPWDGTGAVVFNGDFVDRGSNSLEVLLTLLLLKLAYPNHVFLNRGNHEDEILSVTYGFLDELKAKYKESSVEDINDMWDSFVKVFTALPLCVRTEAAAIMHGGIPSEGFQLSELEKITPEQRTRIKSTLDPGNDDMAELVQNVLWSDPCPENGIKPNEDRDAGVHFGPDVLKRFLTENGLKVLIRSHENVDVGYEHLPCSNEHSVVTVFSASSYPNGEGFNYGAIIRLKPDGSFEPIQFLGETHQIENDDGGFGRRTFSALAEVISQNKSDLLREFEAMVERNEQRRRLSHAFTSATLVDDEMENETKARRLITREQWADCMSYVLDLPNLDWLSLQPYLAPTILTKKNSNSIKSNGKDSGMIDYNLFLEMHCNVISNSQCLRQLDPETIEVFLQNHSMLLTVFKFLDTNRNGKIDRTEFRKGIKLLRKTKSSYHLQDADEIFDAIDLDGNGTIDLEEFEKAFQVVDMPLDVAFFKLMDTDRSGKIDREEFSRGLDWLNRRLSQSEQITDGDALFNGIDANGDGEIDIDELRDALRIHFPAFFQSA